MNIIIPHSLRLNAQAGAATGGPRRKITFHDATPSGIIIPSGAVSTGAAITDAAIIAPSRSEVQG